MVEWFLLKSLDSGVGVGLWWGWGGGRDVAGSNPGLNNNPLPSLCLVSGRWAQCLVLGDCKKYIIYAPAYIYFSYHRCCCFFFLFILLLLLPSLSLVLLLLVVVVMCVRESKCVRMCVRACVRACVFLSDAYIKAAMGLR